MSIPEVNTALFDKRMRPIAERAFDLAGMHGRDEYVHPDHDLNDSSQGTLGAAAGCSSEVHSFCQEALAVWTLARRDRAARDALAKQHAKERAQELEEWGDV